MRAWRILALGLSLLATPAAAQQGDGTLADIRQELTVLETELQSLRRELATTESGMGGADTSGGPIARLDAVEGEVRRLTAATEALSNRIDRIVADGTNRIDDLRFRLTELEGGDVSDMGDTEPLGGEAVTVAPGPAPQSGGDGPQLAASEQSDFDAAVALLDDGTPADAYAALNAFVDTYPQSPLAAQAHLRRGDALVQLGNRTQAGRAYLDAYNAARGVDSGVASQALLQLGQTFVALNQSEDACRMLQAATSQYPDTPAAATAQTELAGLSCS